MLFDNLVPMTSKDSIGRRKTKDQETPSSYTRFSLSHLVQKDKLDPKENNP